jgi:threonine/homoserine/homoserine lactone efflux protein
MALMSEAIGHILPLGLVIALSPVPVIAVVLLLAGAGGRANGLAFLLGWIAGLALTGAVVLLVSGAIDPSEDSEPRTWVSVVLIVLGAALVWLAVKQWRARPRSGDEAELPKWMAAIDGFRAPKALGFGVLLAAANPKHLMVTVAAAAEIAGTGVDAGQEAIAYVVFVAIGTAGVGVPVLLRLALGERSHQALDGLRSWMAANHTVLMAAITLVIGANVLGDGLAGL